MRRYVPHLLACVALSIRVIAPRRARVRTTPFSFICRLLLVLLPHRLDSLTRLGIAPHELAISV